MRISDWSSDVCSSDLGQASFQAAAASADGRQMSTRPASTLTGMTRVQPLSSPSASPVISEMRQLWSGQVTVVSWTMRSEEHTSELQSLMRISYAVFCLKKKKNKQ